MICPYCKTEIPDKALNCPHCTKSLAFYNHPSLSFILLGLGTASFGFWTFWFPPLSIGFFLIGGFFILFGLLSLFTKPLNKLAQNRKEQKENKSLK